MINLLKARIMIFWPTVERRAIGALLLVGAGAIGFAICAMMVNENLLIIQTAHTEEIRRIQDLNKAEIERMQKNVDALISRIQVVADQQSQTADKANKATTILQEAAKSIRRE